ALAAQGAFTHRMAGVALDVDDGTLARGDDLAAADSAEGTHRCRRGGAEGLERRNCRAAPGLRQGADRDCTRRQPSEELTSRRPRCGTSAVFLFGVIVGAHRTPPSLPEFCAPKP